jgi:signal transduction histidine kinase
MRFLTQLSRASLVCLALSLVLLVGYFDWLTGPEISFTLFYLAPIALVTWIAGQGVGIWITAACILTRYVADVRGAIPYRSLFTLVWNETLGAGFFLIVMLLVEALRRARLQLESKVAERTRALMGEIADRTRAQAALRTLAAQLSAAEEAERRRLAKDMHDSLGQHLSLLKLALERLAQQQPEETATHQTLAGSLQEVDTIIQQTRSLMFDLYPPMLDDLGLVAALRWYGERLREQAPVSVAEHGRPQPLATPLASYLFRAVKELLGNAVRHGRAREIVVGVHWQGASLKIVVDDDGSGFDPARALAPNLRGLGLAGIQERMRSLNGRLDIESEIGKGARIVLEVPLRGQAPTGNSAVHDYCSAGGGPGAFSGRVPSSA